MEYPLKPRTEEIGRAANRFLRSAKVHSLPINPFELIPRQGWALISYEEVAGRMNLPFEEIIGAAASLDGFTLCRCGRYTIAYNNRIRSFGRICFTLLHEAGHILLGHFEMPAEYRNSPTGTRVQEQEANRFASSVMAPFILMRECNITTPERLHSACGLSRQAAERRLYEYETWQETETDRALLRQFEAYVRANRCSCIDPESMNIEYEEV